MSVAEDELGRYRIEMSVKTVAALRKRGGHVHVSKDSAGLPRARTAPPSGAIPFITIPGEGWFAHVESGFETGWWGVRWTWFPWPHFQLFVPDTPSLLDAIDVP